MSEPFPFLPGHRNPDGLVHLPGSDTELIEIRDRVAFAVSLIRDHELRLWYERDWAAAQAIAELCPECLVYSIAPDAWLVDDLGSAPAWRLRASQQP